MSEVLRETVGERICVIDRAGLQTLKVKSLVEKLERKQTDSIRDAELVLPASFGGIERDVGLLDESKPEAAGPDSPTASDVADELGRYRFLRIVGDDGEHLSALGGVLPDDVAGFARFTLDLPAVGDGRRQLVSLVPKRVRLDFGTKRQPLSGHISLVKENAHYICCKLDLPARMLQAVELAATWHDSGKARDVWQRAANRKPGEEPLGKSCGSMKRIPGGYRHEFGSLRQFVDSHAGEIPDDAFDLAMHLIATHHGRARPHFPKGGFDPDAPARSPEIAADTIRRFARLQRKYGYWQLAWLENLLRCADAMASAEKKKPMSTIARHIEIPVDYTNPGQFFACCGLLELAQRLWPGAEG